MPRFVHFLPTDDTMTNHVPELLAPAGNREKLETAITYGADAVYLGGPALNLRAPSAGFSWDELAAGIRYAHKANAAAFVCINALPRQRQMPAVEHCFAKLGELQGPSRPDALIIADPGVLALSRKHLPDMDIHLSTQANTANAASVAFWREYGVTRVNIARELSLPEIRELVQADRAQGGSMEFEAFVHGAMCMAVSGRCMLSAHLTQRSANLGLCTHPCRYGYRITAGVEEATRTGEDTWTIEEEDGHTNILAAEDLCLVKYVPWFAKTGVHALKIEGRMKSGGYLAHAVDSYATALADWKAGTFRPHAYLDEARNTASRPLSSGMFLPGGRQADYGTAASPRPIIARVLRRIDADTYEVQARAKWDASQPFEVMQPGLKRPVHAPGTYRLEKIDGTPLTVAHSGLTALLRMESDTPLTGLFLRQAPPRQA